MNVCDNLTDILRKLDRIGLINGVICANAPEKKRVDTVKVTNGKTGGFEITPLEYLIYNRLQFIFHYQSISSHHFALLMHYFDDKDREFRIIAPKKVDMLVSSSRWQGEMPEVVAEYDLVSKGTEILRGKDFHEHELWTWKKYAAVLSFMVSYMDTILSEVHKLALDHTKFKRWLRYPIFLSSYSSALGAANNIKLLLLEEIEEAVQYTATLEKTKE